MLIVLATRTTPIDDAEWAALPIRGATITLHRDENVPNAHLEVVRGDATVAVELAPPDDLDLRELSSAAVAAVQRAQAPSATILDQGDLALARDVAVALGWLLQGAIRDDEGYLGRPGRLWPPDEASARPVREAPTHARGRDLAFLYVVPTVPHDDLICWGDLTQQLPGWLEVVPGAGGALVGPDDVMLGIASIRRDHLDIQVEVRDSGQFGMILTSEQRQDRAFARPIERAIGHGAPIIEVLWRRDVPGEEAIAYGVVALVMELWGGVALASPHGGTVRPTVPATPAEARAESRRLDPDLDWTRAPVAPPPAVRWASTGGVVFDEPVVVPRFVFRGEGPRPVFVARMRVFPTKHVVVRASELTEALGVVVTHGSLRPSREDTPWIATLARGDQGVMIVQSPFRSSVDQLDPATFDEPTRARVEHLLETANPLGHGPSIVEIHVDLVDPADVAIAREVAIYFAERTEGVVAADHPMLLPRAGFAYTARALRGMDGVLS